MFLKSILASLAALPAVLCAVGNIVRITEDFGPNPNAVMFYIYLPPNLQPNAPILVNPHWCTGTAQSVFLGSQLATNADTYGYIMIFPETPRASKCWDLSSPETLKHDAGGDSLGIASMVRWTLTKYGANPNRVFSMGTSSGAMMTNLLMGAYPDLFAAGSAWAGVPFGCFSDVGGTANWSGMCATGMIRHTGAEWKTIVEAAYPGYTGWRPKMQSVHGTLDTVVFPQNLEEQVKQWTAVLGQSTTPLQTIVNTPNPNWTTYIFGDKYQAINATGVDHNIQTHTDTVLNFFDLKCSGDNCFGRPGPIISVSRTSSRTSSTSSATTTSRTTSPVTTTRTTTSPVTTTRSSTTLSTTTTTRPVTTPSTTVSRTTSVTTSSKTTTTAGGAVQNQWGQCGGIGWAGPFVCAAGLTCKYSNDWYSQCL